MRKRVTMAKAGWLAMLVLGMGLITASGAQAVVYGLESLAGPDEAHPSLSQTKLYSFAENGSGLTVYGDLKIAGSNIDADGLAYHPTSGLLGYQLLKDVNNNVTGSQLIQITVQNSPTATTIGNVLTADIRGAVFIGNQLWVLDRMNNKYLEINPTTGAVISTNSFTTSGFLLLSSTDLAYRSNGTTYLVNQNAFYTFNLGTGAVTLAYTDNGASNQYVGLASSLNAPSNQLFSFDVSFDDDIFYHNADNFLAGKTALYSNFTTDFNAGRGDLASYVPLPASMLLLGAGLLRLGSWGWRRRRKA